MDNISITENNNLNISEMSNARVQGDPNVFINSNIVQIGDDMSIQIGSTETLPADSFSYVRNSGDDKNVILNFGIVRGQNGRDGIDGIDGLNGRDGFSPIATVTQTESGATIAVTDATQTTTANITNGTDGIDGFSPIATVTSMSYGALIEITDKNGATSAQVIDGFSPIATVTPTASGATISITDKNGTTTANVNNGIDGIDGVDGVTPNVSATASVNNASGIPSVTVTKSGTTAAPNFDFQFENLKADLNTTSWNALGSYCRYKRSGDTICVTGNSGNNGLTLTANAFTTVATLPSSIAPTVSLFFDYTGRGGSVTKQTGMINTDGTIQLYTTVASSYWGFTVSYII